MVLIYLLILAFVSFDSFSRVCWDGFEQLKPLGCDFSSAEEIQVAQR